MNSIGMQATSMIRAIFRFDSKIFNREVSHLLIFSVSERRRFIDILQYVSTEYPLDRFFSDIEITRKTNKGLSLTKQNILLKNDST